MAIYNYSYKIKFENGTELNLSIVKEALSIIVSIPIINLDLANFNYSFYFQNKVMIYMIKQVFSIMKFAFQSILEKMISL